MATGSNNLVSILGIIAIIAVIAAAAYYITNEADDNELEIDIGLVQEAIPGALTATIPEEPGSVLISVG